MAFTKVRKGSVVNILDKLDALVLPLWKEIANVFPKLKFLQDNISSNLLKLE